MVRVRARSSLSESDLEEVGDDPVGDQNSLCVGFCGEEPGVSGHCEMTIGGIAFSRSNIVGAGKICCQEWAQKIVKQRLQWFEIMFVRMAAPTKQFLGRDDREKRDREVQERIGAT